MLFEAFTYLTTPCEPQLLSMGYLKELIATEARYRRCRAAWMPHLDRTKAAIEDAAHASDGRKKVIVLGAGILSDIPLQFLAERFETVELVDLCFLRRTRRANRHLTNIMWRTADFTGIAEQVAKGAAPKPPFPLQVDLTDPDLVISANVLSQLPLVPLDFLRRNNPAVDEASLEQLGANIVRHHLAHLQTSPGVICLITEVERIFHDGDQKTATEDPLFGVVPKIEGEEWFWDLAPLGEIRDDFVIRNRVQGGQMSR